MLSFEDKILIKYLRECKNYSSRRIIKEFPNKNWKRKSLGDFLRKLRTTGSVERAAGSGRQNKIQLRRIGLVKQLSTVSVSQCTISTS